MEEVKSSELEQKIHEQAEANRQLVIDDFEKGILHLRNYEGVKKFKSIRRAIRRGHVSIFGDVYPKRPFKNCKTKKGNLTYMGRRYYEQATHKNKKVC